MSELHKEIQKIIQGNINLIEEKINYVELTE